MTEFSYKELYGRYQELLEENAKLKARINTLESNNETLQHESTFMDELLFAKTSIDLIEKEPKIESIKAKNEVNYFNNFSNKKNKIILFMSLFKGREDVYAKRWENRKGASGYSPVCLNEWKPICVKPKIKCSKCTHKLFNHLSENTVEEHLRGKSVIGIYPHVA